MADNKKDNGLTKDQVEQFKYRAKKVVQDNIYALMKSHPFYASIYSSFKFEVEEDQKIIPIAAVTIKDGAPIRKTNPFGYLPFSHKEQLFIDVHEILHITDLHHLRGKDKDPGVWNIACDVEINQLINNPAVTIFKGALMPEMFNLPKGLSAEEYYDILIQRNEPIELPPELQNTIFEDLINGDQDQNDGNGDGDQNDGGQGQQGSGNGDGKEKGKSGSGNGSLAKGFENLHPHWKDLAKDNPELQKGIVQGMVREAISKHPGRIPGEMTKVIDRLFEAKLNWPRLLSTFVTSQLTTLRRHTWARPSRKFRRLKPGTTREKQLNLMVALDTSASTDQYLEDFLAEINGMKDYADITIVQCDAQIQSVEDLDDLNLRKFEMLGHGGTSFVPVFELAKNKKDGNFFLEESPDAIVYLTDGYGSAPAFCNIPTLWVLTPDGTTPSSVDGGNVNWGKVVKLDE